MGGGWRERGVLLRRLLARPGVSGPSWRSLWDRKPRRSPALRVHLSGQPWARSERGFATGLSPLSCPAVPLGPEGTHAGGLPERRHRPSRKHVALMMKDAQ